MGYPIEVALRYLGSKKRAFISVGTAFAILGVTLGVAALATVMAVTGGFQAQFREKVLGVNAHVLVLKYSTDFREYRSIMDQVSKVPGVEGTAPFSINPMMLTHGEATATGVLLKGVDPATSLGVGAPPGTKPVLILPQQIVGCEDVIQQQGMAAGIACGQSKLKDLRLADARPAARKIIDKSYDDDVRDAGAPPPVPDEIDDAGRNVSLIKRLEDDIKRRDQEKDAGRGAATPAPKPGPTPKSEPNSPPKDDAADAGATGVVGDITPDGGYASKLPDDGDVLPPEVDPDPCGDPAKIAGLPGIVVGITLAKTLNLSIGDCVTVTSPTIGYSFSGGSLKPPVARRFRVIAMFQAGFDQYDSKLVYTDLYEAQTFYDQGDTVTGVEMIVDDIDAAPAISKKIAEMLGSGLYHTMDWEELNHGLFTALRIQQIGMSIVLALIIVVAAFTVVATLIMVVLDKMKEIAVMKAMGATGGAILRIFIYQGGFIGVAGTALGLLLGLVVCKVLLVYGFPLDPKVYFISRLPVQVRPLEFLLTGQGALAICLEATVLPSLYAAGLNPVEGFRELAGGSDTERHHKLSRPLAVLLYLLHVICVIAAVLVLGWLESEHGLPRPIFWVAIGMFTVLVGVAVSALAGLLRQRWGIVVVAIYAVLITVGMLPTAAQAAMAPLPLLPIWVVQLAGQLIFGPIMLLAMYFGVRRRWRTFD